MLASLLRVSLIARPSIACAERSPTCGCNIRNRRSRAVPQLRENARRNRRPLLRSLSAGGSNPRGAFARQRRLGAHRPGRTAPSHGAARTVAMACAQPSSRGCGDGRSPGAPSCIADSAAWVPQRCVAPPPSIGGWQARADFLQLVYRNRWRARANSSTARHVRSRCARAPWRNARHGAVRGVDGGAEPVRASPPESVASLFIGAGRRGPVRKCAVDGGRTQ